ncbi:MAG: hypothetical protein CML47_11625 [Rhodobacteraceae bacterium]|nr:MAG: hypothetical protein CML47_11625 [Paracoccaceae bacterium]
MNINIPGAFANNNKYNLKEWTGKRGLERHKGEKWLLKRKIRIWSGKKWHCEHNIRLERCIQCGGNEMCEHKKRREICIKCGGSRICEHRKDKSVCKECKGGSICDHGKRRVVCKDCGGSQICDHGKRKDFCKDCGGSQICEHGKHKSGCKDCGGSQICEHGKHKSGCKDCGGSKICEHGKHKSGCKDCGGSKICEHDKHKSHCIQCGGSQICRICKSKTGITKYNKLCLTCAIQAGYAVKHNYKTKELSMVEFITEHTDVDWVNDKAYDLGCSKKRPDMVCDLGSHILIIECDENKHKHGDYSCENKRIMELSQDFSENNIHRPIVIIRFNPDSYVDSNNQKIESCWKVGKDGILRIKNKDNWDLRLNKLLETTHHYISNKPIKDVTFEYLFYDR